MAKQNKTQNTGNKKSLVLIKISSRKPHVIAVKSLRFRARQTWVWDQDLSLIITKWPWENHLTCEPSVTEHKLNTQLNSSNTGVLWGHAHWPLMSRDVVCEAKTSTHLTPSQSTLLTGALQATSSVKACWAGQRSRVIHHPLCYSPESFRVSPPPPLQLRGNGAHTPCQPDQKQPVPGQHLLPGWLPLSNATVLGKFLLSPVSLEVRPSYKWIFSVGPAYVNMVFC